LSFSVRKSITPACAFLALILLTSYGLRANPISIHARKAVETMQQLRTIGVPKFEAGPPAKVPGMLRLRKQELKALIIEDLNDQNRHSFPAKMKYWSSL
jgi:hypothetical protein